MNMRIALTFDDGPNTVTTLRVLSLLEHYTIPASFFLEGHFISDETAAVIQQQVADGCSIECHSFSHSHMTQFSVAQIADEIKRTNDLIEKYAGAAPQFFRPPYIEVNDRMYDTIHLPFICGTGVRDWLPEVSAQERADKLREGVCDGQIVLLHDMAGNENTVEALEKVIPELILRGAEFCTIRDLFKRCGVNPMQPHKLWSNVFD